jgi:hypothetical protein
MSFEIGTKIKFFYQNQHVGTIKEIIPLGDGSKKYVVSQIKDSDGQVDCDDLWLYVEPNETPETSADFNGFLVTEAA